MQAILEDLMCVCERVFVCGEWRPRRFPRRFSVFLARCQLSVRGRDWRTPRSRDLMRARKGDREIRPPVAMKPARSKRVFHRSPR